MRSQSLSKLQGRLVLTLEASKVILNSSEPNRQIHFPFRLSNPTPWAIEVVDIDCCIRYGNVVFVRQVRTLEPLPHPIPRETPQGSTITLLYDPFASTLGLPANKNGWCVEGTIVVSSAFGKICVDLPQSRNLDVAATNQNNWDAAVAYVGKARRGAGET